MANNFTYFHKIQKKPFQVGWDFYAQIIPPIAWCTTFKTLIKMTSE